MIAQEKGVSRAITRKRRQRVAWVSRSHFRLVPNSSRNGAQRNFKIQGRPKREVRPTASRVAPWSRKKKDEVVRMRE